LSFSGRKVFQRGFRIIALRLEKVPAWPGRQGGGVRIEDYLVPVEPLPFTGRIGTVDAICVELVRGDAFDPDVPDVARPVVGRVEIDDLALGIVSSALSKRWRLTAVALRLKMANCAPSSCR
jgi:hypothetical protein